MDGWAYRGLSQPDAVSLLDGRPLLPNLWERFCLEAKRLLSHGEESVSEIALELGFDDASNFSSYFRRHAHMTPGTFRTRSRVGHGTSSAS